MSASENLSLGLNILSTAVDPTSARYEKNMRAMAELVAQVRNQEEKLREGGGAKGIEAQHAKGRLTARERIRLLLDHDSDFFELGIYAANGMYEEWGGAPAAGVVTGLGRVQTRLVMIIANDATVKAGAFFPMTSKKVIRAQIIVFRRFTWSIRREFFCRCKRMCSRTRMILGACFAITR
jgi:3-methylcrotonyl-CoA carboxylase beta subunit